MGVICPELSIDSLPHDALHSFRRRYWDHFQELELPRRWSFPARMAEGRKIAIDEIEPFLFSECRSARIVFVDGCFDATLSNITALPSSCVCLPMNEAILTYGLILQSRQSKEMKDEREAHVALNGALQNGGVFLYIPPGVEVQTPIQIISIMGSKDLMAPRLQLFLGKRSSLNIIATMRGTGAAIDVVDAAIDEGAHLWIADEADVSEEARLFRALRATLKKDSILDSFSYSQGAAMLHRSAHANLCEEGAIAEIRGLDHLRGKREAHTRVAIEHRAPFCRSRQHFKKVLDDRSRSSAEGKIRIARGAQKSDASQLFQNLLLSDEAAATARPNLEILADDVKASHGATFSQPKTDELFYLCSRGFSAREAKRLWIDGFCRELIDAVKIPLVRQYLLDRADR